MIGLREVMTPQDGNKEIARLDGVAFLMVGGIPNSKADISICEIPVGNQADTLALCVYRRVPSGKSGCFLVKRKFNGVEQPSLGEESCGVEWSDASTAFGQVKVQRCRATVSGWRELRSWMKLWINSVWSGESSTVSSNSLWVKRFAELNEAMDQQRLVKRKVNGVEQPSLGEESCGVEWSNGSKAFGQEKISTVSSNRLWVKKAAELNEAMDQERLVKRKVNGVEQPSLGEESCGVEWSDGSTAFGSRER
jgi:hypothetical protein